MFKDARLQERLFDQIHAVEFNMEDDFRTAEVGSILSSGFGSDSFERVADDEAEAEPIREGSRPLESARLQLSSTMLAPRRCPASVSNASAMTKRKLQRRLKRSSDVNERRKAALARKNAPRKRANVRRASKKKAASKKASKKRAASAEQ